MATWQQNINSGGLLAGIGGNTANAPQASDVNATLALIRQNNESQLSGANNVGLQVLQGIGGVAQAFQQAKMAETQKAFDQAHANAWKTGDISGLRDFVAQNPSFVEQAQKAVSGIDEGKKAELGSIAMGVNTALSQGPEAFSKYVSKNADSLRRAGADPNWLIETGVKSPEQLSHFASTLALGAVGPEKMFDIQDKAAGREIQRGQLAETVRSNQAGEALTARGQNISAQNARLAASAPTSAMQNYQEYARLLKADPQAAATFAKVAGINTSSDSRSVQLPDGRVVTVSGNLHGAGANAFYEGRDDAGNVIRVPANAISAPATSSANAQNYAMKSDIDAISGANAGDLDFMTGVTGTSGKPALGADVRSRINGDQRKLYNAAQRVQGRMQNQGVAAARDMGASGINTVAEAKMYFQGMPQIDYSSPQAMQNSIRDIATYTNNYNQQYNVNIGGKSTKQAAAAQPVNTGTFKSRSGITFKVE